MPCQYHVHHQFRPVHHFMQDLQNRKKREVQVNVGINNVGYNPSHLTYIPVLQSPPIHLR